MRPKILLDCDGVLANTVASFCHMVNREMGTNLTVEDITQFDMAAMTGRKADAEHLWHQHIEYGTFVQDIVPYPEALKAVQELKVFCDVHCVTAPHPHAPSWEKHRRTWLAEHFGFDSAHIHYRHDKHNVEGHMLVDDKPENIEEWLQHHPTTLGIVFLTPYSRMVRRAIHTRDWNEIIEHALEVAWPDE